MTLLDEIKADHIYRVYVYPGLGDHFLDVISKRESGILGTVILAKGNIGGIKKNQTIDFREYHDMVLIANNLNEYNNIMGTDFQTKIKEVVVEKPTYITKEVPVEKIVKVPVEVEKIVEKEKIVEVPVDRVVRKRAYYDTLFDRIYNWYCILKGREVDEYV